jgi:hypothetical protein
MEVMKMSKYIIYRAGWGHDWDKRKLAHSNSLTDILCENFDGSDASIPQIGDRPTVFVRVPDAVDPVIHGEEGKTHSRDADWVVDRVDTFESKSEWSEYELIVICYCKYDPIDADLYAIAEGKSSFYEQSEYSEEPKILVNV